MSRAGPAPSRLTRIPRSCRSRHERAPRSTRAPSPTARRSAGRATGSPIRVFMPLLDLDELPEAARPPSALVGAARRRRCASGRGDYLRGRRRASARDGPSELAARARALVAERTGSRPRAAPCGCSRCRACLGVGFNPVSFFFLHGRGRRAPLEAVIAEVTNTPWGGDTATSRAPRRDRGGGPIVASFSASGCTSRPSTRWSRPTSCALGEPGASLAMSIAQRAGRRAHLRRRPGAAATRDQPRGDDAPAAHLPPATIDDDSPHLLPRAAAEAQGCPALPKPRGRILGGIGAHGLSGSGIIREVSEQFADVGRGITLCYETYGDPADPPVLLVMGLATQMIAWHPDFCEGSSSADSRSSVSTTATSAARPTIQPAAPRREMLPAGSPPALHAVATWPRTRRADARARESTPPTWSALRWAG